MVCTNRNPGRWKRLPCRPVTIVPVDSELASSLGRAYSGLLAGEVETRWLTEAQQFAYPVNRIDSGSVTVLIKECVTRHFDRVG